MPVAENFDQAGLYLVLGATRARGLRLQRERIRTSLIRVDPISSTLRNSGRVVRRTCRMLYGERSFLCLWLTLFNLAAIRVPVFPCKTNSFRFPVFPPITHFDI